MNLPRSTNNDPFLVVALTFGFLALLCWRLPSGGAFPLYSDEACELLKGFMCSNGFSLYSDMWNDQPPLHTILLSTLFKLFGPALLIARLLAVGFGGLLLFSFCSLVSSSSGRGAVIAAALFLLVSPLFVPLCFSAMLEVPALTTALVAAWLLRAWQGRGLKHWLGISGLLMGCALQTKLTAALVVPAMAAEILLATPFHMTRDEVWSVFKNLAVWVGCACLSFFAIAIVYGGETVSLLWSSHFSLRPSDVMGDPNALHFAFADLYNHFEGLVGVGFGVVVILLRHHWRQLAFPLAFLATVLVVHSFHRPYWYYYYLHFALPMAWIAGYGVSEGFKELRTAFKPGLLKCPLASVWCGAMAVCVSLTLFLEGCPRLYQEFNVLRQLPRVQDDPLLKEIVKYREATTWIYSDEYIYPFLARIQVPPEIVVLPLKRYWSGQIDHEKVMAYVEKYQPEQVLLGTFPKISSEWETRAGTNYVKIYDDGGHRLFVLKALVAAGNRSGGRVSPTPP